MYCIYCGRNLSDDALYCSQCGRKLQPYNPEKSSEQLQDSTRDKVVEMAVFTKEPYEEPKVPKIEATPQSEAEDFPVASAIIVGILIAALIIGLILPFNE